MNSIINRRGGIVTLIGILSSILFLVACASQSPQAAPESDALKARPNGSGVVEASPSSSSIPSNPNTRSGDAAARASSGLPRSFTGSLTGSVAMAGDAQTGISVTGSGKASAAPDLAVLSLGVEAFAASVAEARDQAATAMDQVVKVLLSRGIAEKDIQTRHFNISPRYTSRDVNRCLGPDNTDCFRDREQVIIGYRVSNQLSVQVRDLDAVGSLIDGVTAVSGDLIRFRGVNFSIEDTKALEIEARAAAVADLMAKAKQIAGLAGVALGKPVFIAEISRSAPKTMAMASRDFMAMEAVVETPILTGELDVVVTLQARYAIQ